MSESTKSETAAMTFRMSKGMADGVQAVAMATDRSVTDVLRAAVSEYLAAVDFDRLMADLDRTVNDRKKALRQAQLASRGD